MRPPARIAAAAAVIILAGCFVAVSTATARVSASGSCLLKDAGPLPLSDASGDAGGRAADIVGGQVSISNCQVSEQVVTASPLAASSGQYLVVLWDTLPGQGQPQSGADFALAYSADSPAEAKLETWDGAKFTVFASAATTATDNADGTASYTFSWNARRFKLHGGLTTIVSVLSVYLGPGAAANELDQTDLPLTLPLSALPDREAPNVSIRSASGHAGSDIKIHFYVGDNSGEARFVVSLYDRRHHLAGTDRWAMEPVDGSTELETHYASRRSGRGFRGRICVQATDPSGNKSPQRCARFTLR